MPLELHSISSNIFLVLGTNRGRFPYSHSILIVPTPHEAVLIDTGCGVKILQELVQTYEITTIINSHTHPDHSAGNWIFQDHVEAILVPKEGFVTSGNILALSERFTEPGPLAAYWRSFVGGDQMQFKDCPPSGSYTTHTRFDFGDCTLVPLHTPGHTIDHYCLYEPCQKILFTFDYDMTSFGPWYGHRESSLFDIRNSLRLLRELDKGLLVSAHRGVLTENINAHFEHYIQKIEERHERIKLLIRQGATSLTELVDHAPIYQEYPYAKPLLRYWEGQMILKHLEELRINDDLPDDIH